MRLRLRVQRHLCVAWLEEDNGDWAFTMCRSGLSKLLGERLVPGEELIVEVSGKVIEKLKKETN